MVFLCFCAPYTPSSGVATSLGRQQQSPPPDEGLADFLLVTGDAGSLSLSSRNSVCAHAGVTCSFLGHLVGTEAQGVVQGILTLW